MHVTGVHLQLLIKGQPSVFSIDFYFSKSPHLSEISKLVLISCEITSFAFPYTYNHSIPMAAAAVAIFSFAFLLLFPLVAQSQQVEFIYTGFNESEGNITREGATIVKSTVTAVIASLSVFTFILLGILVSLTLYRKLAHHESLEEWELDCPHRFRYRDLYAATKGFKESEVIGVGGFGAMDQIKEAVDPKLNSIYMIDEVELVLELGLLCSHHRPEARPTMRQVTRYLNRDDLLPAIDDWGSVDSQSFSEMNSRMLLEAVSSNTITLASGGISTTSINTGR
ncbi:hypothetical protein FH972_017141 [Carpinus fangiana]|uniref:Serine-threonine/tyrosine-protein kinase catalytic domain-containing protein n=1 Tax=Carpinus fangiana TaxID=176857 RepID=A0A5N6RKZ7_9ROSI|nr:hypothetical protein FH972_017141 [Carpinus fangiana]